MKNRNDLIRYIREICSSEEDNCLIIDDLKVPNYVYKDAKVEYPEIRITPFISDKQRTQFEKKCKENKIRSEVFDAEFQIDIFSENIVELNKIYQALIYRMDDFDDLDIIIGSYDQEETTFQDGYYLNKNYTIQSKINKITIDNKKIKRVLNFKNLKEDTWFLGKNGLYIKTNDEDIEKIKIFVVINGELFNDGETAYEKGIYNISLINYRELSDLEKNDVERISFDIKITYAIDRTKKLGPIIKKISNNVKQDK